MPCINLITAKNSNFCTFKVQKKRTLGETKVQWILLDVESNTTRNYSSLGFQI